MHELTDQVAIVTGAAHGIGYAIAQRFVLQGAKVMLADVDAQAVQRAADEVATAGEDLQHRAAEAVPTDVADEAAVKRLMQATLKAHGRLDIVVNNAGIARGEPVTELSLEDFHRVIDVNLTAAFLTAKHGAEHLKKSRGKIVNIASTRALMSEPHSEAYAASKGGLVALTHALALSLGPEVRVNCISPGWIDTRRPGPDGAPPPPLRDIDHQQHPTGRVGRPDDVAHLALFLCSAEAGFLTGHNVPLDGGMTRKMIYAE